MSQSFEFGIPCSMCVIHMAQISDLRNSFVSTVWAHGVRSLYIYADTHVTREHIEHKLSSLPASVRAPNGNRIYSHTVTSVCVIYFIIIHV